MKTEALLEAFSRVCPDHAFEAHTMPIAETVIGVPPACLKAVVACLSSKFAVHHLSTITGQDTGTELELLYHFWQEGGLTLRVVLSYDDARIESLTDAIPGADFYELETAEMLGVKFEGHPTLVGEEEEGFGHFLLPEDWRPGPAPMRKDRTPEEDRT